MSSGIDLNKKGLDLFEKMRIPGTGANKVRYRCIVYRISDDKKEIMVEAEIQQEANKDQEEQYKEIVQNHLPPDSGRYVVWDLKVKNPKSGEDNDKLVFMSWSPDNAPIASKMIFASSKEALKNKFKGISIFLDCSDTSDLDYEEVIGKCSK